MMLLRIQEVNVGRGFRLTFVLTDGRTIERDVESLLVGPVFQAIRTDPEAFRLARAEAGTVCRPDGADLFYYFRKLSRDAKILGSA